MSLALNAPASRLIIAAILLLVGVGAVVYLTSRPGEDPDTEPAGIEKTFIAVQETPEVEPSVPEAALSLERDTQPVEQAAASEPKVPTLPRAVRPAAPRLSMPLELEQDLTDWKQQALAILEASKTYKDGKLSAHISEGDRLHLTAELERLLAGSPEHKAAILQRLLDPSIASNEVGELYQTALQNDMAFTIGKVWADDDPAATAAFLQQQGIRDGALAEGWLYSRLRSGDYAPGDLRAMGFDLDHQALTRTMLALSKEDQFGALDAMFTMPASIQEDQELWNLLMRSARTVSDPGTATWLDDNADRLEGLDAAELFKALRRNNPGAYKSVYSAPETDYIRLLIDGNNFADTASALTELSADYDNTIEYKYARELVLKWAKSDPETAMVWLNENEDMIPSGDRLWRTAYKAYGSVDYEGAVDSALHLEDDIRRGEALSNIIIGESMKQGHDINIDWVNELPPGFTKARTVAGYVLGLSRYAKDVDLEIDLKYQFMQNEFDLPFISQRVTSSTLPQEQKAAALRLLNNY